MRRIISYIIPAILLLVVLPGCSVSDTFSDYVEKVTTASTGNSLRMEVRIDFRKECQYHVEYWKTSDPSDVKRSRTIKAQAGVQNTYTIMFLYPQTEYSYRIVVEGMDSKTQNFRTGALPPDIPEYKVEESDGVTTLDGYLMQWEGSNPGYVTFCDWDGNIVWYNAYGKGIRTAWFDRKTRQIAILMGFKAGDDALTTDPFYRLASDILVSDLCGNITFSRKASPSFIEYPHHEFKVLEDGNYAILHNVVKDGIYGEGISICSPAGDILWTWDSFKEINPGNAEYLDAEKFATDYIHSNSIARDCNGDYYMTVNRLSELWKIDGKSGDVIYRLGVHGNIDLINSEFPAGGLHAAEAIAPDRILCYSNGSNTGISKGVIFNIDPESKSAHTELEIELPSKYSSNNRSNTQMIDDNLFLLSSTVSCKAVFTDRKGKILRVLGRTGISYRSYWFSSTEI